MSSRIVREELFKYMSQSDRSPLTKYQMQAAVEILNTDAIYSLAPFGSGKSYLFNILEEFLKERGSHVRHLQTIEAGKR